MESFESDKQNCVLDSLENGELIKLDDDRWTWCGCDPCCRVLTNLEQIKIFFCRDQREWNYYHPCKRSNPGHEPEPLSYVE